MYAKFYNISEFCFRILTVDLSEFHGMLGVCIFSVHFVIKLLLFKVIRTLLKQILKLI